MIKNLEDDTVTVPASVAKLLDTQHINYDLSPSPEFESTNPLMHDQHLRKVGAAKSIILQDEQGTAQVLIPANCLLDLNQLNQTVGRKFSACLPVDMQKLLTKISSAAMPAVPELMGLPTFVDQRLLQTEAVYLDSGNHELLRIQQSEFSSMLDKAVTGSFTRELTELEQQANTSDSEAIFTAVKQFTQMRIKQRLEETLELPPLPDTAQKIIQLRVDPNADINDLAAIVETDPSLAAQVVSWASSPYYSAPGKIKSIHDAIVRVLGFDMVLNLALGLALGKTLNMPQDGPFGVEPYWKNAVYTAATVEGLVTAIPRDQRPSFGMAYLSGLLSNFGMLILAEVFPPYFENINRLMEANPHVPYHLVEKHVLGISRDQLAGWLMQLWNMPEEVVSALRFQSDLDYQEEHAMYGQLIHLSNNLLGERGLVHPTHEPATEQLYRRLGLDSEKVKTTMDNIVESAEELTNISAQMDG